MDGRTIAKAEKAVGEILDQVAKLERLIDGDLELEISVLEIMDSASELARDLERMKGEESDEGEK